MLKNIITSLLLFIGTVYLVINIYLTQSLPPLFYNLVNKNEAKNAVEFLKKINKDDSFADQLSYYKSEVATNIENQVLEDYNRRKIELSEYEKLLVKNDKSRDILVKLALLNYENENIKGAFDYYQKAKVLDPLLNITTLEKK